jgi:lipoprotein-anchoring transpeptidase ErfK/SrfK
MLRLFPVVVLLLLIAWPPPGQAGSRVATITPPRTLELTEAVIVRKGPDGAPVRRWEAGTLLTSDRTRAGWVRVSGRFPGGHWRPIAKARWVPESAVVAVRPLAPKQPLTRRVEARTYQLETATRLRDGPRGRPMQRWPAGTRFTVRHRRGDWLAVSGHFPEGRWQPLTAERWVRAAAARDISPPPAIPRPDGAERFALVDKSEFELRVVQKSGDEREVLYRTTVGLGMDDCLPEAQGGNCYYTEPGTYQVRWRIYRPDGIDWCIPESMADEPEYAADLARGKRCFEGVLGKFALNIGQSYAIHGTRDLDSLGKKESHGCIRGRPGDVRKVWRYLRVGDRVVIRE